MAKSNPKPVADKAAFFAAVPAPRTEIVETGGFAVTIREMNVGERLEFEQAAAGKPSGEVALLAIAASVIDAGGNLMFGPDDLPKLKTIPPDHAVPVMRAVLKLNALTDQDVSTLAKNS